MLKDPLLCIFKNILAFFCHFSLIFSRKDAIGKKKTEENTTAVLRQQLVHLFWLWKTRVNQIGLWDSGTNIAQEHLSAQLMGVGWSRVCLMVITICYCFFSCVGGLQLVGQTFISNKPTNTGNSDTLHHQLSTQKLLCCKTGSAVPETNPVNPIYPYLE